MSEIEEYCNKVVSDLLKELLQFGTDLKIHYDYCAATGPSSNYELKKVLAANRWQTMQQKVIEAQGKLKPYDEKFPTWRQLEKKVVETHDTAYEMARKFAEFCDSNLPDTGTIYNFTRK